MLVSLLIFHRPASSSETADLLPDTRGLELLHLLIDRFSMLPKMKAIGPLAQLHKPFLNSTKQCYRIVHAR